MGLFASAGRKVCGAAESFAGVCRFAGETLCAFLALPLHPRRFRLCDFLMAYRRAAYDGLAITAGMGLLLGVILAFESAASLRAFGAEIYVSDLLSIGLFRELAPLVTAVVLAGRCGGAFAAEIGTMKVDDELDALSTMGLSPVGFLVPPRVLAAVLAMPVLTAFAELAGLAGGAGVLCAMGVPPAVYWERVAGAANLFIVAFGLSKACLFGLLAGLVGCFAGLNARRAADGVGAASTSAVVGGIVAIAVADGIAAFVCNLWGV